MDGLKEVKVKNCYKKPLTDENIVPTVCLIAAINIVLSVSLLDVTPVVCVDISSWLVIVVNNAG